MNIIDETIRTTLNILRKKYQNVIFESVYEEEVLKNLVDDIRCKVLCRDMSFVKYSYDDLLKKLPSRWRFTKYLNRVKILYVLSFEHLKEFNEVDLTDAERVEINERMKNDDGFFSSDFDNDKNSGIIVLNHSFSMFKFDNVVMHELIHFFQWDTGRKLHDFMKEKQIDVSEEDKKKIAEVFGISNEEVEAQINRIITTTELEAYCNTVFYDLRRYCKEMNIHFCRQIVDEICDSFDNKMCRSFEEYYRNILKKVGEKFNGLLKIDSFIFLLILGYFNFGYRAFKNHIFSYYDKDCLKN